MSIQRRSETFQNKEGNTHRTAKERVCKVLQQKGFDVYPEARIFLNCMITGEHGEKLDHIGNNGMYMHPFDIIAYKTSAKSGLCIAYVIEIDGEIHKKKRIEKRDKKHEAILSMFFPDYQFKRIEKIDVISKHITDENIASQLGL